MKTSTKTIFTVLSTLAVLVVMCGAAFAQGVDPNAAAQIKAQGLAANYGVIALAAGIGIGIAALGGALAQGRAAAAALDGIARNPGAAGQIRGPMILGLALIESLVIYALIIALLLVLKVG